jgi:cytochrome P450
MKTNFTETYRFLKDAALYSGSEDCYALGDFRKLFIPTQQIYLVNDADVLKYIAVENANNYEKSKIYWKQLHNIIGDAMGSIEGDNWLVLRKIQNQFYTKSAVQGYMNVVCDTVNSWQVPLQLDAMHDLATLNLKITLSTVFGSTTDWDLKKIHEYIYLGENLIYWQSKYPWRTFTSKFTQKRKNANDSLKQLSAWTQSLIANKNSHQIDLIQTLLENNYTETDIRNELIVHLGASTETAAVAQTWALYLLTTHPQYLKMAQDEVSSIFKNNIIDEVGLQQLQFLPQVMYEAMRLYPPSHALVRDAMQDDMINNIQIKKNDTMYISVYGIHRNKKYWTEADTFMPERFEEANLKNHHPYQFVGFGAGKHSCIGKYLAMPLMLASVAKILLQFNIELMNKEPITLIALSTLKPKQLLKFILKRK